MCFKFNSEVKEGQKEILATEAKILYFACMSPNTKYF